MKHCDDRLEDASLCWVDMMFTENPGQEMLTWRICFLAPQ
jgi:hypothetical protein